MRTEYNPDVLSCLANLSSDEVFTPPRLANEMLDLLPVELWSDKNAKFLDPCCKTGVFLREIAKRLLKGLEKDIPDLQKRIDHIFRNQLYGIAITELTALMSRRTLYCSKTASGEFSICRFRDADGNIRFERTEHIWRNGKCSYCGASQEEYARGDHLETHAYELIHTHKPGAIFNMRFDVIIGNPPYQLSDGGHGTSASPLYHEFVTQAKKINPRFLVMITPSRWFGGGKGLDPFREAMLNDAQMRKIVDFVDASEVFPGVDIAGGVSYFLWASGSSGDCEIETIHRGKSSKSVRPLNEFGKLVRYGEAVSVIRKILARKELSMADQVSSRKPFGFPTNARPTGRGEVTLVWNGGEGKIEEGTVSVGRDLIGKWKVITSKVSYDHGGQPDNEGKRRVLSKVEILPPQTVCTETYLVAGAYESESEARNLADYLRTKFVRFLISQLSYSQDITKERFAFVPVLDMKRSWDDAKLASRYGLSDEEVDFIDSTVRPMQPELF